MHSLQVLNRLNVPKHKIGGNSANIPVLFHTLLTQEVSDNAGMGHPHWNPPH